MLEIDSTGAQWEIAPTAWKKQHGCCAISIVTVFSTQADFIKSGTKPPGSHSFEAHGPFTQSRRNHCVFTELLL